MSETKKRWMDGRCGVWARLENLTMRTNPIRGERWRHCKGTIYEILEVGTHSETQEKAVIYRAVEDGGVWVRPLAMFMERHPTGAWRFERLPDEPATPEERAEWDRLQAALDGMKLSTERR